MEREEPKGKSVAEMIMMGEKLNLGAFVLGKREGKSTPSPPWKVGLVQGDGTLVEGFEYCTYPRSSSARKLGANLWENEPFLDIVSKDSRMSHHHRRRDSAAELNDPTQLPTKTSDNVRKQLGKVERDQEPLHRSPTPCSSSEMAHHIHRRSVTPSASLDSKAKFIESSRGLKTSTELLKLLNRIWSLEERNALNASLVRKLKKELYESQAKVKELLSDKIKDEKEIRSLTKQLTELNVDRNKEQERVRDALSLMEEKLSDESKIRKSLEKHQQNLNHEISETKSSLEGEVRARRTLEALCDEFAKGIKDYERELRFLRQRHRVVRDSSNHVILHVSEAWLDERKLHPSRENSEKKKSIVENLYPEIEALLRSNGVGCEIPMQSMESLNANEPQSAPWKGNEEDEDYDNNSNYYINGNDNKKQANGFRHEEETPQQYKPMSGRNKKVHDHENVLEGSFDPSAFVGPTSPVEKWTSFAGDEAPLERRESSKSNTLRAKLIEARLESQRSRARR